MKSLLEQIDLLVESSGDYFWLVVPFNRKTVKYLSDGRLKSLEGISGSRRIIDFWAGTSKAVLKMKRREVEKVNRDLISVSELNPKRMLKHSAKVMQRLMDQPNYGHAIARFIQNYIKHTSSKGGELAKALGEYIDRRSFVRYIQKMESPQEVWDWYDGTQVVHRHEAILRRLLIGWMKREGVDPQEIARVRNASFEFGYLEGLLQDMRDKYAAMEDEYLVGGDVFKVPSNSELYVVAYDWSDRVKDIYAQRKEGVEDKRYDMSPKHVKRQIDEIIQFRKWIDDYGLDERYDITFVSDVSEIK